MDCKKIFILLLLVIKSIIVTSQEQTAPIFFNGKVAWENEIKKSTIKRTEPITLPLIETFYYYEESSIPSDEWWTDAHVYINNHFSNTHYNKGIATFDVIDQYGKPYASENPWIPKYCDTLTSYFIDLSSHSTADSIYLSFDYLAGGLGFAPKPNDSLIIYFKDSINGWIKVDQIIHSGDMMWKTKMIPIKNTSYFYTQFQFRIINKGTIGHSGSQWHIDNVIMDEGRSYLETSANNVAFTCTPFSFFKDFTSMPWKHYNTDRTAFTNDSLVYFMYFNHLENSSVSTIISYSARINSGSVIASGSMPLEIIRGETNRAAFPNFLPSLLPSLGGFENILNIEYTVSPPPTADDSYTWDNNIVKRNHFSNYMSYDDGTSEQAYFLNLSPGLRGEVAIEYACYVPDTLAGIQIQFVPQIPYGEDKEFYIRIYKSIEVGSSGGEMIYEQSGNYPLYTTDNHGLVTYALDNVIPLSTGIFYVSIMMPASGISDSLMIGLDMNRTGGNHRYYNVLDTWESSLLEGALLVRPVFSSKKLSTEILPENHLINLYPNPSSDKIFINSILSLVDAQYTIYNINGKKIKSGKYSSTGIDIQDITSGMYFLCLENENGIRWYEKFIKK